MYVSWGDITINYRRHDMHTQTPSGIREPLKCNICSVLGLKWI